MLSRLNEVAEKIQEILGLDYEQFRKIVMIPQGEFRRFLTAPTGEKQQILRQLFGTELFPFPILAAVFPAVLSKHRFVLPAPPVVYFFEPNAVPNTGNLRLGL